MIIFFRATLYDHRVVYVYPLNARWQKITIFLSFEAGSLLIKKLSSLVLNILALSIFENDGAVIYGIVAVRSLQNQRKLIGPSSGNFD